MNKTLIFFIMMVCVLFLQEMPEANAQQGSTNPPHVRPERAEEATRNELLAFYDKIKSINEDCRLKREALKIALSEEAKKVLEDRQEERHAEEKNK